MRNERSYWAELPPGSFYKYFFILIIYALGQATCITNTTDYTRNIWLPPPPPPPPNIIHIATRQWHKSVSKCGGGGWYWICVHNVQWSTAAHNQSESHCCNKDDTQTNKETNNKYLNKPNFPLFFPQNYWLIINFVYRMKNSGGGGK